MHSRVVVAMLATLVLGIQQSGAPLPLPRFSRSYYSAHAGQQG